MCGAQGEVLSVADLWSGASKGLARPSGPAWGEECAQENSTSFRLHLKALFPLSTPSDSQ